MGDWATAIAGLGGAAIGIGGTWAMERWRWQRSQEARWLDERRRLCARLVSATGEAIKLEDQAVASTRARSYGAETGEDVIEPYRRAHEGWVAVEQLRDEIQLIGAEEESSAAGGLVLAARAFASASKNYMLSGRDSERWREERDRASDEYQKARSAFLQAARRGLT